MLRVGVRRVLRAVSRAEGDLVKGNETLRHKEKAMEDAYIRQREAEKITKEGKKKPTDKAEKAQKK